MFATQYPDKPEVSLESFKAWIRGLQRDLLDAREALIQMRAGSLRLVESEFVAAQEGANPTLGDRREAEAVVTVAVNELLVSLAAASEADVQALKDANRNLTFAIGQLQASLDKGLENAEFDLKRAQDLSNAEAEELTGRLASRNVAKANLELDKQAQKAGAMARFDTLAETWGTRFSVQVNDLISSRVK